MLTDSTDEEDAVELRTVDENGWCLPCGWLRQRERCGMDPPWRSGVPPDASKLGPDVTIEDPDYQLSGRCTG